MESFMLPCLFRAVSGMNCPGCGFQRSVYLLFTGRFRESVEMYWPSIPVLLLFAFMLLHLRFHFRNGSKILVVFYILNCILIICHYFYKQIHHL